MILTFFNPLMVAAWFARQLGMLGLDQIQYPYKPGHIWSPHSEVNIINLPISHWLGTSLDDPIFLWKLPWTLFKIQTTCCYCINQLVFQSGILGNMPSHLDIMIASLFMGPFCCIY